MGQTGAEWLKAEGRKEGERLGERRGELRGRREVLLEVLDARFGEVPPATSARIKGTRNIDHLKAWLLRATTADTLADVGIT